LKRSYNILNPENKKIVHSRHGTPAPSLYNCPSDSIRFGKQPCSKIGKEKKFFKPSEMSNLKAVVPVQYTGLDGVSPEGMLTTSRGSRLSGYVDGSRGASYR
jgi:hypothetical protein